MNKNDVLTTMWEHRVITCKLLEGDRICGGVPTSKKLIEAWIASRMKSVTEEERARLAEATVADLAGLTEEAAAGTWTTFKRDSAGVFIEGRQIKAAFKESANILRPMLIERTGGKTKAKDKDEEASRFTNLKAKLAERLYVEDRSIHFYRNGQTLVDPDGIEEKAIHVMVRTGPRDALKRVDYVAGPADFKIHVRWIADGVIDDDLLEILLDHMMHNGLGADRSQGNGRFSWETIETAPARMHKDTREKT